MGFGYSVQSDMVTEAIQVFRLGRLNGVRQLSYLRGDHTDMPGATAIGLFDHTRWLHSLDTHAVAILLAHNCRLLERDSMTLRLAALTHDALTPAGGDATKLIDRERFDEDANFSSFFSTSEWGKFKTRWNIDEGQLHQTVLGKGILGQLLDIADKTSYLSRDAAGFLNGYGSNVPQRFAEIATLVKENPHITALWEVTTIIDGKVVITDPDRLAALLELRARLFRDLYYNPNCRLLEYLLGKGVTQILFEKGEITYTDLITRDDAWLEGKVNKYLGTRSTITNSTSLHARFELFPSPEEALVEARTLNGDPQAIAVVDVPVNTSNTATRGWNVKNRGRIVSLETSHPATVHEIEGIMTFDPRPRLCVFSAESLNIPPAARKRVRNAFKRLLGRVRKKAGVKK